MNKLKKIFSLAAALAVIAGTAGESVSATFGSSYFDTGDIAVTVDTGSGRKSVSPYIYGISAETDLSGVAVKAVKQSDWRVSSYNWETNSSSGGSLVSGSLPEQPALYTRDLVRTASRYRIPSRYVTLQMMGMVSDGDGWSRVYSNKHDSLLSEPDKSDGAVYMDEYVSYLVNRYGYAVDGGINGYFLDSEPENWSERFPEAAARPITAEELAERSAELAEAVKNIDPTALVYGPSVNGIEAFTTLKNPDDWEKHGQEYSWFIDYYLDSMKKSSQSAGMRLLDVLDIHYRTEATNGLGEPIISGEDNFSNNTRLQAPRILWDSTYTENSPIAIMHNQHIPLIPTLEASVNMYYPGTKLSFSEYNFGGGGNVSGGIAEADALGIFASYGVHMACLKPDSADISYQKSAINIYTNYDGNGNGFGDTLVRSDNGGDEMSSVYASVDSGERTSLKMVLINKNWDNPKTANITIKSDIIFESAAAYGFNGNSPEIVLRDGELTVEDNAISFVMEPLSVYMLVFEGTEEQISIGDGDVSGVVSGTQSEISVTASAHEHVEAETYSTVGTTVTEREPDNGTGEVPSGETVTAETSVTSGTGGTSVTDGEPEGSGTDVSGSSPGQEKSGGVPKGVKIAVCVLVGLVALGMVFVIVQDIIANKKK